MALYRGIENREVSGDGTPCRNHMKACLQRVKVADPLVAEIQEPLSIL